MRFNLKDNGIIWTVKDQDKPHTDELEMSGMGTDFFVCYGTEENNALTLSRYMVFPQLRTIPNNTHGSFQCGLPQENLPFITVDGDIEKEYATSFFIDGTLTIESKSESLYWKRRMFATVTEKAAFEIITLTNRSKKEKQVKINVPNDLLCRGRGTKGCYRVEAAVTGQDVCLRPGESAEFAICYSARIVTQKPAVLNAKDEWEKKIKRMQQLRAQCRLQTPDKNLDCFYALAKQRASESIFQTDAGPLHSPGGRAYYAATWCNDQVEYAGPLFAMTGDDLAVEASVNAYEQYIPFMDDNYHRIPCSVIAEGRDIWEDAGDRGDAAMYLYGASLFCLSRGDREIADKLWPAIKWCAEYCKRVTLPEGVIFSNSDELEGRFPTDGRANLSTSCLCCGGLKKAAILAKEMGEDELSTEYEKRANALADAIESYFGADLHGFHTYRYSKGYDTLRGWICLPLVIGLTQRAAGTVDAMLSPYLWTEHGMLSCELGDENKSKTIWDRSALYAYKGAIISGKQNEIWSNFESYIKNRLTGDRVPHPVEAWPEGNMRHLAGESALFCRVITEGLFGLDPVGLNSFAVCPKLPDALPYIKMENIRIAGRCVDIYADHEKTQVFEQGEQIAEFAAGQKGIV